MPIRRSADLRSPDVPSDWDNPFQIDIHDIGHAGEGVGKHQGLTVFVPGAIPGDRVLVEPVTHQPRYMHAKLLEIVRPSVSRVDALCPVAAQCGGCQLQNVQYAAQVAWKEERVRQVLTRVGKVHETTVLPIISAAQPWDYRNKAQFPVGQIGGVTVLGFYQQGSHNLIQAEQCLVQHPRIRVAASVIARLLNNFSIPPYDEKNGKGLLRHVLCRVSFQTNELLVTLVTNKAAFAGQDELVTALAQELSPLAGVTLNINTQKGNRILGDDNIVLYGKGFLTEVLRVGDIDLEFHVSAPSFFQVNPIQAQELFAAALNRCAIDRNTKAIDAYCGTGSIALFLARAGAEHVWGIEEVAEAVADANVNAKVNDIGNVSFLQGKVEHVATGLVASIGHPDVLVVDPPRAGLAKEFIDTAVTWRPRRFVYVSCNPATLARDINLLEQQGYRLNEVQPVDMFPHTAHIECVALLSRVEK